MSRTFDNSLIGMLLLALAGCGAMPRCEPQIVKVPVPVGCLGAAPTRPVNTFNVGAYPGEKAAAQAALVDAAAWEGYAIGLEVAQAGCDKKPAGAADWRQFFLIEIDIKQVAFLFERVIINA